MDYNIDIVNDQTGEIYKEGMKLTEAHEWIAKQEGMQHVKTTAEDIPGDSIDDAVRIHTLWVKTPEHDKTVDSHESAASWWNYSSNLLG